MSLLTRLDDFVVDRVFQPIVNKTGIDPAAAARSLFIGDAIFTSCGAMARYMAGTLTTSEGLIAAFTIAVVLPQAWMQKDAPSNGLAPAARHYGRWVRLLGVFIVAFGLINVVANGLDLPRLFSTTSISAFAAALYLGACRKPPPRSVAERKTSFAHAGAR